MYRDNLESFHMILKGWCWVTTHRARCAGPDPRVSPWHGVCVVHIRKLLPVVRDWGVWKLSR